MKDFVERRLEGLYLVGSRVPFALIVDELLNGEAPESIRAHYPTLSLEQVYGAITFYLGNKSEAEEDLAERRRFEDEYSRTHTSPPEIKEWFERMRRQLRDRRS